MGKAILILDNMPEYCSWCPVYHNHICGALGGPVADERDYNPCPLRELPEPREERNIDQIATASGTDSEALHELILAVQDAGYNSCLREITGEVVE